MSVRATNKVEYMPANVVDVSKDNNAQWPCYACLLHSPLTSAHMHKNVSSTAPTPDHWQARHDGKSRCDRSKVVIPACAYFDASVQTTPPKSSLIRESKPRQRRCLILPDTPLLPKTVEQGAPKVHSQFSSRVHAGSMCRNRGEAEEARAPFEAACFPTYEKRSAPGRFSPRQPARC